MKAFESFFHPRRTARLVDTLREDLDDLTTCVAKLRADLTATRAELEDANKRNAAISEDAESLRKNLEEKQLEREEYDKIVEMYNRMNELREKYEKRIARLRRSLQEARAEARGARPGRELSFPSDIDFGSDLDEAADRPAPPDPTDWLDPLPPL